MIPSFPDFKKIELSDKAEFEKYTRNFQQYSHLTFHNLYGWNTFNKMAISSLDDNIVILFTCIKSGTIFMSFCGKNCIDKTVRSILEFAKMKGIETKLKEIPLEIAENIDTNIFLVEADAQNFDYVYSNEELSSYPGSKFSRRRREAKYFLKTNKNISHKILDLCNATDLRDITDLFIEWQQAKILKDAEFENYNEFLAFQKMLEINGKSNIRTVGVYVGDTLKAFGLCEILPIGYAHVHFLKSDITIKGLGSYLVKYIGSFLHSIGIEYSNYAEDMGDINLRICKERYRPVFHLKKFSVSLRNTDC